MAGGRYRSGQLGRSTTLLGSLMSVTLMTHPLAVAVDDLERDEVATVLGDPGVDGCAGRHPGDRAGERRVIDVEVLGLDAVVLLGALVGRRRSRRQAGEATGDEHRIEGQSIELASAGGISDDRSPSSRSRPGHR